MCGKRGVCVESVWLTEGGCGVPHPSGHQRSGTRSPGRRSGPIESRRLFPSCNASSDGFPRAGESLRVAPAQGLGLLTAGSGTRSPSRSGSQADAASTRAGPLTRPASLRAPRHCPGGRSESPVGAAPIPGRHIPGRLGRAWNGLPSRRSGSSESAASIGGAAHGAPAGRLVASRRPSCETRRLRFELRLGDRPGGRHADTLPLGRGSGWQRPHSSFPASAAASDAER